MTDKQPDPQRKALREFRNTYKLSNLRWAKASGLSEGTIRNYLAGPTDSLNDSTYRKLAQGAATLLDRDVSVAELRGERTASAFVAIVGKVGAGAQVFAFDDSLKGAGIGEVERPPGIAGSITAVQVEGDSMLPAYRDQDILFYTRDGADDWTRHVGDECVVQVSDGRVYVKVLRRGTRKGTATLSSYNAADIEGNYILDSLGCEP